MSDATAAETQAGSWKNVGQVERWLSLVAGAVLIAAAAKKRNAATLVAAGAGVGLIFRGASGHCPIYAEFGMSTATDEDARLAYGEGFRVERGITIQKSIDEVFDFWRDLANLPKFMEHVIDVKTVDDRRSHWTVQAPMGRTVEWDAEIIHEVRNQVIGWKTVEGADVKHAGSVQFRELPAGRGTELRVELRYDPPGGHLGKWIAAILGEEPSEQVASDLRRLKRLLETGEEPTVEGQPSGRA
jgi:uncharacterized membrane protein